MLRKRATPKSAGNNIPAYTDVVEWVQSLPWVVEWPPDKRWPDVRVFGIDCPPLNRRRMWLLSGVARPTPDGRTYASDLAAVMPVEALDDPEAAGWEVHWAPLTNTSQLVLVTLAPDAEHELEDVEAFVLAAYSHVMA